MFLHRNAIYKESNKTSYQQTNTPVLVLFALMIKILKFQNLQNLQKTNKAATPTQHVTEFLQVQSRSCLFCLQQVYKYLPLCMWSKGMWPCRTIGFKWRVQTVQYIATEHRLTLIPNRVDCNNLDSYRKICFLRQEMPQIWSTTYRRQPVGWLHIELMFKLTVMYFVTHHITKRLVQQWIMEYYQSMQVTMHFRYKLPIGTETKNKYNLLSF